MDLISVNPLFSLNFKISAFQVCSNHIFSALICVSVSCKKHLLVLHSRASCEFYPLCYSVMFAHFLYNSCGLFLLHIVWLNLQSTGQSLIDSSPHTVSVYHVPWSCVCVSVLSLFCCHLIGTPNSPNAHG